MTTASELQTKLHEYKTRLIQNHIDNNNLSDEEKKYKLFIIDIGLNIMEYALSDFTIKISNNLKSFSQETNAKLALFKQKMSIYVSLVVGVISTLIPFIIDKFFK